MSLRTFYIQPIEWYIDQLETRDKFAVVSMGDCEWLAVVGDKIGDRTAAGQTITEWIGERLTKVLLNRHHDPDFLISSPVDIWSSEWYLRKRYNAHKAIEKKLLELGISDIELYERMSISHTLSKSARLYPLIKYLRDKPTVMVGNKRLQDIKFLNNKLFIGTTSPGLSRYRSRVDNVIDRVLEQSVPGIYLISCGLASAVIIDALYDKIPNSKFFDCGSIWDAFVGLGRRRWWRRQLYGDPALWESWKKKNLKELYEEEYNDA